MATIHSLTEAIDTWWTHVWYTIQKVAIDNILDANPVWAALKERGCMVTQEGERFIQRTIRYGKKSARATFKGDVFPHGEDELETGAFWNWKYIVSHVQRSIFDDQQNRGAGRIRSLVQSKIEAARESLIEKNEDNLFLAFNSSETASNNPAGLNDLCPADGNKASGNYGRIPRSNSWWRCKYKTGTAPYAVNIKTDMTNLYNTIGQNKKYPNLMLTTQTLFEAYENYGEEKTHVVKSTAGKLLDLGFEVLHFKGHPMIWGSGVDSGTVMMLDTDFIEMVYDPIMWFDMTNFKDIDLMDARVAHILCALNMFTTQPRRHGRLVYA